MARIKQSNRSSKININDILILFIDLEHSSCKLQKENEMRKEDKFCDLTIKINGGNKFRVHKLILASSCPYFNALFNGDWKENREDVVSLDYEIEPECFEIILEYIYTLKLGISEIDFENALILHKGADYFSLFELKKIMSKILQKFISIETLHKLWLHGDNTSDVSLRLKCLETISKISISFLQENLDVLTFQELNYFCKNEVLECSEEELYENLLKWYTEDTDSRADYLMDLLDLIDFSKISGEFMQSKILNNEIFLDNEDFRKKIMEEFPSYFKIISKDLITIENKFIELKYLLITDIGIYLIDLNSQTCVNRLKCEIPNSFTTSNFGLNSILICGGVYSDVCKYYAPDLNFIREIPSMFHSKWEHRAFTFHNKIYSFGGNYNYKMEIFNTETEKWTFGTNLPRLRWNFALEELDGIFYLIGGNTYTLWNDTNDTIPTDKFNIREGSWTVGSSVKVGAVKSVRINNIIYLFYADGYNKRKFNNFDKINEFKYDEKLSSFDVLKVNNEIFIFGKISISNKFFTAFIDIETGSLEEINIDLSECDDVGKEFHLSTAYF